MNQNLIMVGLIFNNIPFSLSHVYICRQPVSCHQAAGPCTPHVPPRLRLGFQLLKTQGPGSQHRHIDRQMVSAQCVLLPRRAPGTTPAGTASSLSDSEWALCMVLDKGPPDRALSGNLPLGRGRAGTGLADLSDTDPVRVPGLERGGRQNGDPCHGLREVLVLV